MKTLDEMINEKIDFYIAQLEAAKSRACRRSRVQAVQDAVGDVDGWAFYWDDKIQRLTDSL
jgi:hypothetical protein